MPHSDGLSGDGETFSSRWGFFLAAIGFSVGLGNIWRFPFVTGQNGGSAFLIIYLVAAFVIGLPLLISELTIGRHGRSSPAGSIARLAAESSASRRWGGIGTLAVFCVFMILTYYTVVSGWTLDYLARAVTGEFGGIDASQSSLMFDALVSNPWRMLFWNTVVHLCIYLVVRRGVQRGIEQAVKVLMPILFGALAVMVVYGALAGDMRSAASFLLEPDFSRVDAGTVMSAIGQAFFSIGIGMGTLMAFGAYLPDEYSVPRSATGIILADTGVALIAGFAIFPFVFAFGLSPSGGPGLTFETLPIAFGQMGSGQLFGSVFFVLLFAAALSSCIGCGEAVTFWMRETFRIPREPAIALVCVSAWIIGIVMILSLGAWSGFHPLDFIPALHGMSLYDATDFLAANILLLAGALLTAVFFGWIVPDRVRLASINLGSRPVYYLWLVLLRFVIPPVLVIVLVRGLTA